MKKLILAAALVSVTFTATARPIDGPMKHIAGVEGANAFADYVVAHGYRCDSITSFMKGLWSTKKFTLKCNNYRYSYDIEDRGGRWVVTVN